MPVLVRVNCRDGGAGLWPRGAARLVLCAVVAFAATAARAQEEVPPDEREFGPVVRAYLGYLRAEQLVTDDRASRREVSSAYVRRNSNRVRALRQMAIRIARETRNDYLPELYAVARDELGTLFEPPPRPEAFRGGEILNDTFRYLGPVRTGELFYLFARLDIYEQAELLKKHGGDQSQPAPQPARAASQPPDAEPQSLKTSEGGATQTRDAGRRGTQGGGTQPAAVASPATRPRRVPPPAAERPPGPEQQR